jgi:hypothetical protein
MNQFFPCFEAPGAPIPAFETWDKMNIRKHPMSEMKFTVGGAMEEDASRKFIDAWHRAERGESVQERLLAFESWDTLATSLPASGWSCCDPCGATTM